MAGHETPDAADRRELALSGGEQPARWRTRFAGLFLFLPLLARLGFSKIVDRAGYPGTKRVPADAALLSLLTLKLLDKERHSHIEVSKRFLKLFSFPNPESAVRPSVTTRIELGLVAFPAHSVSELSVKSKITLSHIPRVLADEN